MKTPAKGETVEQTVENLQAIMAKDAVEMEKMGKQIARLTEQLNKKTQSVTKWRTKYYDLLNQVRDGMS